MKLALTSRQVRALEEAAVRRGISIAALMESAGAALAEEAMRLAPNARFFVLCGRGNNGGGGVVGGLPLPAAGGGAAARGFWSVPHPPRPPPQHAPHHFRRVQ